MMTYRVIAHRLARQDLDKAYLRAARVAPLTAARWVTRFQNALRSLDKYPTRFGLARENGKVDLEIREMLFGRRPYVYRVLFSIQADIVRVLRILRAQRRALSKTEIEEAAQNGE